MLVSCFKAQSFNNYNLVQNKNATHILPKERMKLCEHQNTPLIIIYCPFFIWGKVKEHLNFPSILFKIMFFFRSLFFTLSTLSGTGYHLSVNFAESIFGWSFHNCRLKLIAFDKWHSSSRNIFLIIQIIITKEIDKSYFFIMDAIIKKFPGRTDVSHEANGINKSYLGT